MMREIEIKLQFSDMTASDIRNALPSAQWSEPFSQADRIFLDRSMTEYKITPGTRICRLRRETSSEGQEELSLTMKIQQQRALESIEYETTIGNEVGVVAMLSQFGFDEFVAVEKTRQKSYVEPYNLCLDEVGRLGTFLEIELLTEGDLDAETVQTQMVEWAQDQGLNDFTVNMTPYDTQMYNLQKVG